MKIFLLQKSNKNMPFITIGNYSLPAEAVLKLEAKPIDDNEKYIRIYTSCEELNTENYSNEKAAQILDETTEKINNLLEKSKSNTV